MLHQETWYRTTAHAAPVDAPLAADTETEVVIIGGGFAGLATAMSLRERGRKFITVLEAETVGFGASGRNGGFVFGGFSLDNADLIHQVGLPAARQLYGLTLQAIDHIRRRIRAHEIDCEAVESGVLLANWFDDDARLRAIQRFMRDQFDVDWTWLSRDETRAKLNSTRYFSALHERNAFHFHPLKYAQGLAKALVANGVRVHEGVRVQSVEKVGAVWRVRTTQGEIRAREVVFACGGYIGDLFKPLSRAILPIATYVMVTEPLGERLRSAMRTQAAVYDTRFAFDYYRPLPDSRLLWGGRISIRDRSPAAVARLLYKDMLRVYPQLAGVRVEHAWSGLMSYARHKMPQIGQLPNGAWYAMGFGGHGVGPTTLAGEVLAQAMSGEAAIPDGFARYGLPPTYGVAGRLAAQATYWWLQWKDALRE